MTFSVPPSFNIPMKTILHLTARFLLFVARYIGALGLYILIRSTSREEFLAQLLSLAQMPQQEPVIMRVSIPASSSPAVPPPSESDDYVN